MADLSIDFSTKARQSDLSALQDAFLHGLEDYIKDGLILQAPTTLDWLIEQRTCLFSSSGPASTLYAHLLGTVTHQTTLVNPYSPNPPMNSQQGKGYVATSSWSLRLRHQPKARHIPTSWTPLLPFCPWKRGHGEVHQ